MKKLIVSLLSVLALSLASAGSLPNDARFDQPMVTAGVTLPLDQVLKAMGTSVGLKVILKDVPSVPVDSDFDNLPFRQAWDLLINTYGNGDLDYVLLDNDVMLVGPKDVVTRSVVQPKTVAATTEPKTRKLFPVNDVKLADFIRSEVPGVTVLEVPGQKVLSISGTSSQLSDVERLLSQIDRPVAATSLKTFTVSNPSSVAAALSGVVGAGEGAPKIFADERSGTIVVQGSADSIAQIEALLPTLDKKNRNVRVRVRIQSIDEGTGSRLGFTLGATQDGSLGNAWSATTGAGLFSGILNLFNATNILTALNLNATLNALDSQGISKTINQADQLVEGNGLAELTSGGTLLITVGSGDSATVQSYTYGTNVSVRPKISPDGNIILVISTKLGEEPVAIGETRTKIPEKKLTSTFTIAPGQTVIMGGLTGTLEKSSVSKFPILGDIPILGAFFSNRTTDSSQTQLLISVTADFE